MIEVGLLCGCLTVVSDSYSLAENFYLPINEIRGAGPVNGSSERTEEQLPKPIEEIDGLLQQLGSPFVADTGNDGYPILDWEKQ